MRVVRLLVLLLLVAAPLPVGVTADAAPRPIAATAIAFTGCSGSEQEAIGVAVADARALMDDATAYFADRRAGARYATWFGAYQPTRWALVRDGFAATAAVLGADALRFTCHDPDCGVGVYGFVYPSDATHDVRVCDAFWSAPALGEDSRAGTLVHLYSQFADAAGTQDHGFGKAYCQGAAVTAPDDAVETSDCYEYFAEDSDPVIPDAAPAIVVDASAHAFGATAVGARSAALVVTVRNTGDVAMTMGPVSPGGPFAIDRDACSSRILAAGATCTFDVRFAPTAAGAVTGSASVPSDAAVGAEPIALTGTGLLRPTVALEALRRAVRVTIGPRSGGPWTFRLQVRRHGRWTTLRTASTAWRRTVRVAPGRYRVIAVAKAGAVAATSAAVVVRR